MTTTLYLQTRLTFGDVKALVATVTGCPVVHGSIPTPWGTISVGNDLVTLDPDNGDPDDFLNWPYYLGPDIGDGVSDDDFLRGLYQLRNGLVEHGVRVWIVSDLDHRFPPGWTPDG